jgi:hypothetical protein
MKFVLSFTLRASGSAAENIAGGEAGQKLLSSWLPSEAATIREWVSRCDGNGGFAVIETDNGADLFKDLTTWSPWFQFQVFPVIDIGDATPLQSEALATAKSAI